MSDRGTEHPLGLAPPDEWWTEQNGHAKAEQFQAWIHQSKSSGGKRPKYGQKAGFYEDLGLSLKSLLEAKTLRYLLFIGYTRWIEKGVTPPTDGKWVCYEWCDYKLPVIKGRAKGTIISYLPDFHLWTDGSYEVWESKGMMGQRSKQRINLWPVHHPSVPLEVITAVRIEGLANDALREARRRQSRLLEIPNWNLGPTPKGAPDGRPLQLKGGNEP